MKSKETKQKVRNNGNNLIKKKNEKSNKISN